MDSNNYGSDVIEIDLLEIMGLLWHRLWLIVICALFTGMAGFLLSRFVITEQYQSETTVYVLNRQNDNTLTYSDVQLGTQLTKDFPTVIKSRHVAEQVIAAWELPYGYETLVSKIDVEIQADTRMISIIVTDEDPKMAQDLANEIRKVASERIKSVMDIQAVNVVDEANFPERPASPSVGKWTVIGALIGAVLCIAVILIHFMLDDTVKTADDIEKYLGLSTLGMIPEREDSEKTHRPVGRVGHSGEGSEHALFQRDKDSFADTVIRKPGLKDAVKRQSAADQEAVNKPAATKAVSGESEEIEDIEIEDLSLKDMEIEEIDLEEVEADAVVSQMETNRINIRQENRKKRRAHG